MNVFVILFGLFIIVMAGFMALNPKRFTDIMLQFSDSVWMHVGAVAVRIVLGIVLILVADQSRFPMALHIIGWIAIVAGVMIALVPHAKFTQLIHWVFSKLARYTRIAAIFALLFGGFLIYAVI